MYRIEINIKEKKIVHQVDFIFKVTDFISQKSEQSNHFTSSVPLYVLRCSFLLFL